MGLKDQARMNADISQQATSTPSGCKACQRKGLPIFPLRVAAVPATLLNSGWKPGVPKQDAELTGGEFKYSLRTLRMGYLYVLLDQKIWQGYAVTAEGYLRQFDPMAMPESETVEPLSQRCLQQGHEISASFINIDDEKFSQAWLAFSSDPWSKGVLKDYKSGTRPSGRFTKILLKTLKNSPASVPEALVMDPALTSMKANVAEFATTQFVNTEKMPGQPPGGAHGFYPRLESAIALGFRVAQLGLQYQCQIAALALNDTVGIIQELNNSRMQVVEARQTYNETPAIYHKQMISSAIEQYLASVKTAVEETSQPRYAFPQNTSTVWGGKMLPKEQVARETYAEKLARLQQYYNEPVRADFAKQYQQKIEGYQKRIDAIGKDLAAWYQSQLWLAVINYDYAPETCIPGWVAQFTTLTTCLQGGSTDKETETVWHEWLSNKEGLVYTGLLGYKKDVFNAVYDGINWYTNAKVFLGSDEIGGLVGSKTLRRALVQRTLAMSGSYSRLVSQLEQSAQEGYTRVMQGFIYMTSHKEVTLFNLNITLGEFQQYIADLHLSASGKSFVFEGLSDEGKKLTRSVSSGSQFKISDPELLKRRINVTLVSDMSPDALKVAVRKSGSSVSAIAHNPLTDIRHLNHYSELRISSLTLAESASGEVVSLSQAQIQETLRNHAQMTRRIVSGNTMGVGLAAGMLYLQITSLEANRKALDATIGNDTKARLALLSNMTMVVSSMTETAGFVRTLAMEKPWALTNTHWLIRAGGVIAGVAAIIDGFGMFLKGLDAKEAGDIDAKWWYYSASGATLAGGVVGIYAAYASSFALMGPAGLAALLLIAGAALVIQAEKATSTAFELWLRRCCFGYHQANAPAWNENSPLDLKEALTAYDAIVNGLTAEVGYQDKLLEVVDGQDLIRLRIVLPCCDDTAAAWDYSLSVPESAGSSQSYPLLATTHNIPISTTARLEPLAEKSMMGSPPSWRPGIGSASQHWLNGDLIIEGEAWVDTRHFMSLTLEVNYWPDRLDQNRVLRLKIQVKD
jgi:hypothetical protein